MEIDFIDGKSMGFNLYQWTLTTGSGDYSFKLLNAVTMINLTAWGGGGGGKTRETVLTEFFPHSLPNN